MKHCILTLCLLLPASTLAAATLCGDCNFDGQITILDALRAAHVSFWDPGPAPPETGVACEVSGDMLVTILDALLIAQLAVGLPVTLTCPDFPVLQIRSPIWGSVVSGDVLMSLDVYSTTGNPLTVLAEYSVDGGATWAPATQSLSTPGTLPGNPSFGVQAGTETWGWDSATDAAATPGVRFRATVTDSIGVMTFSHQLTLDVM